MLTIDLHSVATLSMQDNPLLLYTANASARRAAWAWGHDGNSEPARPENRPYTQALRRQQYGHNDFIGWFWKKKTALTNPMSTLNQ